jgi:hypothetical protein
VNSLGTDDVGNHRYSGHESISLTNELVLYYVTNTAVMRMKRKDVSSCLVSLQKSDLDHDYHANEAEWSYELPDFEEIRGFVCASQSISIEDCLIANHEQGVYTCITAKQIHTMIGTKRFLCFKNDVFQTCKLIFHSIVIDPNVTYSWLLIVHSYQLTLKSTSSSDNLQSCPCKVSLDEVNRKIFTIDF